MNRFFRPLRYFSLFLLLTGMVSFTPKPPEKKIVCFGDSITFGAQVNGHSWVYYLNQAHKEPEFINAGRSGRKTADREELLPVLEKYSDAEAYLFFLGVNDLKDGTDSMVNSCVSNMKWMINQVRTACPQARIIVLAPSGINLKTMSTVNQQKKYNQNTLASLGKLERRYQALAKEEKAGFISLLHTVSPMNFTDGLHPDEKGQQQIAAAVWKGLKKLLDSKFYDSGGRSVGLSSEPHKAIFR